MTDLLHKYDSAADLVGSSVAGLSSEQLLWKPPAGAPATAGTWSIQEVVIHLQDADLAFADRFKRIIASDAPVLQAWSENDFTKNLFYTEQSVSDAIEIIRLTHRQMMRIFRQLPDSAFSRTGTHTERGVQTLTDVLKYASWHVEHHVAFIQEKRKLMAELPA
jgi:uncharacterized damage-inducible protein DinB